MKLKEGQPRLGSESKIGWRAWFFTMIAVVMLTVGCTPGTIKASEGEPELARIAIDYKDGDYVWGDLGIASSMSADTRHNLRSPLCDGENLLSADPCLGMVMTYLAMGIPPEEIRELVSQTYVVMPSAVDEGCSLSMSGVIACAFDHDVVISSASVGTDMSSRAVLTHEQIHRQTEFVGEEIILEGSNDSCAVITGPRDAIV